MLLQPLVPDQLAGQAHAVVGVTLECETGDGVQGRRGVVGCRVRVGEDEVGQ